MAQVKNNPIPLDNLTKLFGTRNNVPGEVVPGFLGVHNLLHVENLLESGSSGTFTSGAWRTRSINTVKINSITGASLTANQITLPFGNYFMFGEFPAYSVGHVLLQVYNITGTQKLIEGQQVYAYTGTGGHTVLSLFSGYFSITEESVIEIQHYCTSTLATSGFGNASFDVPGPRLNGCAYIWKIA
jgi:hypothetical protein